MQLTPIVGIALIAAGLLALALALYASVANAPEEPDAPIDHMGRSMTFSHLWFVACVCGNGGLAIVRSWPWWLGVGAFLACYAASIVVQRGIDWMLESTRARRQPRR